MMRKYYLSIIKKRGFLILFIIMLFYISFAVFSNLNQFINHVQRIEVRFVFPILVSFTITIIIKSIRQLFLIRQIGINICFKRNILIYFAGLSMLVTPGGMGQVIKSHFLLKFYAQPISKTLPIVIVERYHDILALFSILIIFSVSWVVTIFTIPIIIIGIMLIAAIAVVKNRRLFTFFQGKLTKVKILKMFENSSLEFNRSLSLLFNKRSLLYGWSLSLSAWFFEAVGIFLCFLSFGLNVDFVFTTAFGLSSTLFGAISFIPGGAGVTELIFIQLLSSHGMQLSTAAALVLFYRLLSIWYATGIGLVATKFALQNKNESK